MKELSLNILDIAENSIKAEAEIIKIEITEENELLTIRISDDGLGMTEETLHAVSDPFYTTRTTRKVGMGIPLFRTAAEQTGGSLTIASRHIGEHPEDHGTEVTATFHTAHIDFTPLGDLISTMITLLQGHPDKDFIFMHRKGGGTVSLDTREMREVLEGIPLDTYEVLCWVKESLTEQYNEIK